MYKTANGCHRQQHRQCAPWQDHDGAVPIRSGVRATRTLSRTGRSSDGLLDGRHGEGLHHLRSLLRRTFTSFPNITLVPAGRAGLCFSLSMTTFGTTNLPFFATSLAAMPCSAVKTALTSLGFCPH